MFLIVPNHVSDAIDRALEKAFEAVPEAVKEREQLYGKLLDYYNEHGAIPDFTIVNKQTNHQKPE